MKPDVAIAVENVAMQPNTSRKFWFHARRSYHESSDRRSGFVDPGPHQCRVRGGSSSTPPSTRSLSGLPAKGRGVGDGPIALAQRRLPHPRRPGAPAGPHRHEGRCVSCEESFVAVGSTQGPSSSPGWVTVIQDSSELSPCSHHQVNHILCYCLLTILRVKQGQGGATRSSAVHHPLIPHPQAPDSTKELKTDKEGVHGHPWRRHKAAQRKFEVSQRQKPNHCEPTSS